MVTQKQAAAIEKELAKLTKVKRKKDEPEIDYLERVLAGVAGLGDDEFDSMSDATYEWYDGNVDHHKARKADDLLPLVGFDGEEVFPDEEDPDEEEEPEEEEPEGDDEPDEDEGEESEPDEGDDEEEEEPEPEPEPKKKAPSRKKAPTKATDTATSPWTGRDVPQHQAYRELILLDENREAGRADLLELGDEFGITSPRNSKSAIIYHTRETVRVLTDAGVEIPPFKKKAPAQKKAAKKAPARKKAKKKTTRRRRSTED